MPQDITPTLRKAQLCDLIRAASSAFLADTRTPENAGETPRLAAEIEQCLARFESSPPAAAEAPFLPDGEVDFHETFHAYRLGLAADPGFLAVERLEGRDIVTVLLAVEIPCPQVDAASTLEESLAHAREALELNPLVVTLGGEELFHYSHAPLCVGEESP